MKPTLDLLQEHGSIKVLLRILEKMCGKLEFKENVDSADMKKIVALIREFADKCHHGKEENLLFPAMKENNIPEEVSLVDLLIEEHNAGRNLVKNMAESIGQKDLAKFSENARGYVKLLDQHINKENTILFPMAGKSLTEEKQKKLAEGFEDIEKNVIGEGRHEELHKMIHELKKIYLSQP